MTPKHKSWYLLQWRRCSWSLLNAIWFFVQSFTVFEKAIFLEEEKVRTYTMTLVHNYLNVLPFRDKASTTKDSLWIKLHSFSASRFIFKSFFSRRRCSKPSFPPYFVLARKIKSVTRYSYPLLVIRCRSRSVKPNCS